jgi:anti-anti-sigma factor
MNVQRIADERRRLRVKEQEEVLFLGFLDGQLLAAFAPEIGDEFSAAAAREGFREIVLDFSGVSFACSDVLGKLVILNKRMRQKGGRLKLCGVCPHIREVLAVTKLDTILDVVEQANGTSPIRP